MIQTQLTVGFNKGNIPLVYDTQLQAFHEMKLYKGFGFKVSLRYLETRKHIPKRNKWIKNI